MRNILLATTIVILLFNSCKKEDELVLNNINITDTSSSSLFADFSYEVIIKENEPDIYKFKNKSKNASSFKWYFGNFDSSNVLDPSITFPTEDFYIVKLVISDGKETKMKAYRIEAKDFNPGDVQTTNILDFKININCDSTNLFKFINISSGYSDFLWSFYDGTQSTAISPEHLFKIPASMPKTITLRAKDVNGNLKSITKTVNTGYAMFKIEQCAVILINQNPVKYRFYEAQSSYQDLIIDYITYFNGIKTDTIKYENSNTELDLSTYQGVNTFKFHNVHSSFLTVYKIVKTPSVSNTISKINRLNGSVDFHERYMLEEISYTAPRRTEYNDTTLNVNLNNGINVSIIDSTLKHSFAGYPVYWNNTLLSDSNLLKFTDYNMNSPNPYFNTSKQIQYNTVTNDITASYYYYQGGKVSVTTQLIYNGRLR